MCEEEALFGDVPGVAIGFHVGTRKELAKAGVHPPIQAGIAYRQALGAYSIVLSGGYEDDEDFGNEVIYTGQGGQNPGSKAQVRDQTLDRGNAALFVNRREGRPVRLTRGADPKSSYAPTTGYRYDGLYFVADAWAAVGRAGFRVYRYRLVRDDERDPPWLTFNLPATPPGPTPRTEQTVQRLVRSTAVARQVKLLHGHACQVCGVVLQRADGPYAEAAHVRPLGRPHNGPDVAENVLCLCPNHHVLFDGGAFAVADDLSLIGLDGRLRVAAGHTVAVEYLRYHRALMTGGGD